MTELKPCPFCGGKAELITDSLPIGLTILKVECTSCESSTGWSICKDVIVLWNRRVTP